MTEGLYFYGFYAAIVTVPMLVYLKLQSRKEGKARAASDKSALFGEAPRAQHPHIDVSNCIGCQGCTSVCPEGNVLGMIGGKAAVIAPHRCIGHAMCFEACPVGAITMRRAVAGFSADLPYLTEEYETNLSNLFIAGELGGLALIRNAVQQGRDCIDIIASRKLPRGVPGIYDVLIVGAGPAGISASLRAIEVGLHYVTLEREEVGGTVSKYPRQKLVMTGKVDFPIYGAFKKMELSKENLLEFWKKVSDREDFHVRANEVVESIRKVGDSVFVVTSNTGEYRAHAVVLAIGRNGVPRKLGVPGEALPKVMYRLIDAEQYVGKKVLVVGGGDSAVEAALGLALQKGNKVTISYRKEEFARIKERNAVRLSEAMNSRKVTVIFQSNPVEIRERSVVLDIAGVEQEIANDYVWVFAGGVAPNDFLKKIGISFGSRDLVAQ